MAPRILFSRLREHALTAIIVLALLLAAPFSIPSVRSELLSAFSAETMQAEFDSVEAGDSEASAPDPAAPAGEQKPGAFKRIITSPVRLFARIFRGKNKNQETAANKPAPQDVEKFRTVPVTRIRDGMGSEVAREDMSPTKPEAAPASVAMTTVSAERAAATLFDQAFEMQQQGQYDQAIDKLRQSLSVWSKQADAHNLLGVCLDQKGQFSSAQSAYQDAIRLEKANPRFLNNLGYSYYLSGDDNNAVKFYKKAVKVTPEDKRLHNNLGLAYGRKGDLKKSLEHFRKSVGEAGAHQNLGYVLMISGRQEEAIREYETALRLDPQSVNALGQLVKLYERTGRIREASYATEMYKRMTDNQREKTAQQK